MSNNIYCNGKLILHIKNTILETFYNEIEQIVEENEIVLNENLQKILQKLNQDFYGVGMISLDIANYLTQKDEVLFFAKLIDLAIKQLELKKVFSQNVYDVLWNFYNEIIKHAETIKRSQNKINIVLFLLFFFVPNIYSFEEFHGKYIHAYTTDPAVPGNSDPARFWKTNLENNIGIFGNKDFLRKWDERVGFNQFLSKEFAEGRLNFDNKVTLTWQEWAKLHTYELITASIVVGISFWALYEVFRLYKSANKEKQSKFKLLCSILSKVPNQMIKRVTTIFASKTSFSSLQFSKNI